MDFSNDYLHRFLQISGCKLHKTNSAHKFAENQYFSIKPTIFRLIGPRTF